MANYPIPNAPVYNADIPALNDTDPASATNTFNPLIQILVNNTHAVKLASDALSTAVQDLNDRVGNSGEIQMDDGKTLAEAYSDMLAALSAAESSLASISSQISGLSGFDISGASDTAVDLPDPASLETGTMYVVQADENHSGKSTVYEVIDQSGTKVWQYLSDMGIDLEPYMEKAMLGVANGAASLGSDGKLPGAQVPNPAVIGFGYGTCGTAAGTAAKVGTLSGFTLKTGGRIGLKFTNADTSNNPTLNVNGTGAKPVYYNGARATSGMITAGWLAEFVYDGTNWNLLNPASGGAGSAGGFIVRIAFDSAFSSKAFTVTGGGFTYNGTVPASLSADVLVPNANTTYTITCSGNTKSVTTSQYFGIYAVTIESISATFASNTWAQIGAAVSSGSVPSTWKVGDTKDITLTTGEVLTLAIYGKNFDDLQSGGKAALTFGLKNLMAATRAMNGSNTNSGGFTGSAMYTWLQGDLYNSLPADLRALIKTVNKKTSAGSQSPTINTNAMKIFLFSEVECFGATTYSFTGEGSQYPIFTDNTSRIKYLSNGSGSAGVWWERSPYTSNSTYFCVVNSGGGASYNSASNANGVCFGFCI